ncbi:MAG: glutamine--tRNA ligase/YqeY domain fusion protein [Candidatus Cloacimonetes bacterium]|nr:glutamine--tRNA ligase/YqeY domain fusion protein [Candidatus Cloacimonadota bacterium]MBL7149060.1 glutamine--tRNA ligase/YqeY domain fusion protein [Candidatus Cloacimonadota bacterium]
MKNEETTNFIRNIIDEDIKAGKHGGRVHTRFPPEPNGHLHIGHAKAILLNYGIAEDYNGKFNLRFDDTNPEKEEEEYVNAIINDIKWLGCDWEDRLLHASDYFEQMYKYAVQLVKAGKAYVDSQNSEDMRKNRGTVTKMGKDSPFKNRSIEENLNLLEKMKNGEFEEGAHVLRAKIDMASANMLMRDPLMYRIRHAEHYRTGKKWHIYPMYDFAHCLEDSIEGITHSLCSIEFENNRPLYDWFLDQLNVHHPQQIEFARLYLSHTVLSKRKLIELVEGEHVRGWDDPRMPTISGLRRRGYTPDSIRNFCDRIGLAKRQSIVDTALLEFSIREELNKTALRRMAVLDPIKVIIENYPDDLAEEMDAVNNPEDPDAGSRKVPFSKIIYIEREDFMEDPPKKFFRLAPGSEVRLRYAYFIKCEEVVKDEKGNITELRCSYDPQSRGGKSPDGRKVKATLHWVSAKHAIDAEVRLYEHLFTVADLSAVEGDFKEYINPDSLQILTECKLEPSLLNVEKGSRFQFERKGYFCVDTDSAKEKPVFNRTVTLRDEWARLQKRK